LQLILAVDGKCLHLVQRPPPSSTSASTSTNNTSSTSQSDRRFGAVNVELPNIDNLMMGSFTIPVTAEPSSTLCGNRITVARHMLQCANNIAAYLENPENGLNNQNIDLLAQQTMESTILEVGISAVTDADLPHQEMQNIVQAFQGAVSEAFRQNGINNITVQQHNATPGVQVVGAVPNQNAASASSSITIEFPSNVSGGEQANANPSVETPPRSRETLLTTEPSRRQQTTSPQTLADVVEMMQTVQTRLNPFIQEYYSMLREDPSFPDEEAQERSQRIFNRTSEALHYMAHAQHAISDLMFNLSLPQPRHLCCRPILVEQSAFVSSGISQSINIGSLFGRAGAANRNNNNNNNSTSAPTANNANQNATSNDASSQSNPPNAGSFPSSLLSAMGLNPININSNRTDSTSAETNTTNTSSTTASNTNTEGQLPRIAIPSMGRPSRRVIIRQAGRLHFVQMAG
jgi:large proline-rich protein BAG6